MSNSIRPRSMVSDILYGNYIRYDRMYEMTKYAFYGSDSSKVNIYIDLYSMLKSLYSRGLEARIDDFNVIASCMINLAIHLRAYFETRHQTESTIYLVYGGARPSSAISYFHQYNSKNILMEDSDSVMENMIKNNIDIMSILCPYLYNIYCIADYENEFSVIVSSLIDSAATNPNDQIVPSIIYSKDPMSYQLVAFKPMTFLYRPKKRSGEDCSWVVTKSTLYNAYRYGELSINKEFDVDLDVRMFSIYLAIAGVRSRSIPALKNANTTAKLLQDAVKSNTIFNGYNINSIFCTKPNPLEVLFSGTKIDPLVVTSRLSAIDLLYQTSIYSSSKAKVDASLGIVNLYNPDEVRAINNKYFRKYPLDLNRV